MRTKLSGLSTCILTSAHLHLEPRHPFSYLFPHRAPISPPPSPTPPPVPSRRSSKQNANTINTSPRSNRPMSPIPPTTNPRGELIFSSRVDRAFRDSYERYRSAFERRREEKHAAARRRMWWGYLMPWRKVSAVDASGSGGKDGGRITPTPTPTATPSSSRATTPAPLSSSGSRRGSPAPSTASSRGRRQRTPEPMQSSPLGKPVSVAGAVIADLTSVPEKGVLDAAINPRASVQDIPQTNTRAKPGRSRTESFSFLLDADGGDYSTPV